MFPLHVFRIILVQLRLFCQYLTRWMCKLCDTSRQHNLLQSTCSCDLELATGNNKERIGLNLTLFDESNALVYNICTRNPSELDSS